MGNPAFNLPSSDMRPANDTFGDPNAFAQDHAASVNDYMDEGANGPTTSINHIDEDTDGPVTSINSTSGGGSATSIAHVDEPETKEEEQRSWYHSSRSKKDEAKDEKESTSKQSVAEKRQKVDPYALHLGRTGRGFRDTGKGGFKKRMNKYMRAHRSVYRGLSVEDKKELHDIITKNVKHKAWGSEVNARDKLNMRRDTQKLYRSKKISSSDRYAFKKVIKRLSRD